MQKAFTTGALLGLVLLAAGPRAQAQTPDQRTAISISANTLQYKGNFGSQYWNNEDNWKLGAGFSLSRYLTSGLDVGLHLNYGKIDFNTPNAAPNFGSFFSANVVNANVGLKLKLNNGWALKETGFLQPYLLIAPGAALVSSDGLLNRNGTTTYFDDSKTYFDVHGAAGITFRISESVGLFVQTGQHFPLNANFDMVPARDDNSIDDRYLQHTAGLTVAFGRKADADGDGVSDRKDKCSTLR